MKLGAVPTSPQEHVRLPHFLPTRPPSIVWSHVLSTWAPARKWRRILEERPSFHKSSWKTWVLPMYWCRMRRIIQSWVCRSSVLWLSPLDSSWRFRRRNYVFSVKLNCERNIKSVAYLTVIGVMDKDPKVTMICAQANTPQLQWYCNAAPKSPSPIGLKNKAGTQSACRRYSGFQTPPFREHRYIGRRSLTSWP